MQSVMKIELTKTNSYFPLPTLYSYSNILQKAYKAKHNTMHKKRNVPLSCYR